MADNKKAVEDISPDHVNSDDRDAIAEAKKNLETLVKENNLTQAEKDALKDPIRKAEDLLKKIEATEKTMNENRKVIENILPEKVTSEQKSEIEAAKQEMETLLKADNLTAEQRKDLENALKKALDLLKLLEKTEKAI